MDFGWLHPEFSTLGVSLGAVLVGYLLFVEPVLGVRTYAYLRRERGHRSDALLRVYGLTLGVQVAWLLVVLMILLAPPTSTPARWG